MPKTALIINPWVTDFKLYDEWMHPLGLYFLISLLKHNDWDIQYINCLDRNEGSKQKRFGTGTFPSKKIPRPEVYKDIPRNYKQYGITEKQFQKQLKDISHPDIVFISSTMTYWIEGLVTTVKRIRKIFSDIPIIVGGISASLIPEIVKKSISDVFVFSGSLFDNSNKLKKLHSTLDTISLHGWTPNLIDAYKLIQTHFHGPLFTSFGCPFRCSYCASSHLQKEFQLRPHTIIIDEMKHLIEHAGVTDFAFYDDALLYQSKKNFLPLAEAIAQCNSTIRLHVPNGLHIRWLDNEVLNAMQKCNFVTLRFGYESSNIKHQKEISAKTDRKQIADKIKLVKSACFKSKDIGIYVMGGLPNQTVEDVIDEISFIFSLNVKVKPVFLSPVPHTQLFEYYAKIFPQLRHDPLFHNDTFFITQLPGWSYSAMEEIKSVARELNKKIMEQCT